MYNTDYIFITLWQIHNTSRRTERRNKKIWANDGWADNTCVALLASDRPTDSHEESCGKWMWKYILNEWTSLNTNFVVFYLLFSCANKCDRPHPMRSPFSVLDAVERWRCHPSSATEHGQHSSSSSSSALQNIYGSSRDQNFGLNELAAVQDVRNDFNLQDIADEPAIDRGKYQSSSCGEWALVIF